MTDCYNSGLCDYFKPRTKKRTEERPPPWMNSAERDRWYAGQKAAKDLCKEVA